jgi:hypothetical protein
VSLKLKRTLSGWSIVIGVPALIGLGIYVFGAWAMYLAFWAILGLVVIAWIVGMLTMWAHDLGKMFFPDPPEEDAEEQLELPL